MSKRILIVEDHPIFAEALALSIHKGMPDSRLEFACSIAEAKHAFETKDAFDLVLLDLCLPDTHGFDGLIELHELFEKIPIVVMSAFADPNVVHVSEICGAIGFIPKSSSKGVMLQALNDALAGKRAFANEFSAPAPTSKLGILASRLETLTKTQLLVLQYLCRGFLNKQIAHELDINETTVKAHVGEILRKLGVGSRTQAVLEVLKLDVGAGIPHLRADLPAGDSARAAWH